MPRYIDAEALKKDLTRFYDNEVTARELIDGQPTADVQPVKHGRWINTGSGQECSICKEIQYGYDTGRHYCPNCGSKNRMDGDDE